MLSASPVDVEQLVNDDFTVGTQRTSDSGRSIALHDDGHAVVVFSGRGPGDNSGVFFRQIDAVGNSQGPTTRVNETVSGVQRSASVTMADDGRFVVTWEGRGIEDSNGVFARAFNADGTPASDEFRVNQTRSGRQDDADVANRLPETQRPRR